MSNALLPRPNLEQTVFVALFAETKRWQVSSLLPGGGETLATP